MPTGVALRAPLLLALAALGFLSVRTHAGSGAPVRLTASRAPSTYVAIEDSFLPSPTNSVLVASQPKALEIGSADSTVTLRGIAWEGWGSANASATASGTTCGSGGPEGYVCDSGTVKLTATNLVGFAGAQYYASVVAVGIPGYGPTVALPVRRPSQATLSRDCGYRYHAGRAVGDGEFSGGVMQGAINISCPAAWSLVRPRYESVIRAEQARLESFRIGSFACHFRSAGPDTEKICRRGREEFFFL